MKKIIFFLVLISIVFVSFTACSTVKSYVYENKELIQLIIKTIVEQLLNMSAPAVETIGDKGISPRMSRMEVINTTLESEQFWKDLEPKIELVIKTYQESKNGSH